MKLDFSSIPGTVGQYKTTEIIVSGPKKAIEAIKNRLTLTNKSVLGELKRLKSCRIFSHQHAAKVRQRIQELEGTETITCYGELDDPTRLSIPPGCHYLCETIVNNAHLLSTVHPSDTIQPYWLGYERYYQEEIVQELLKYRRASIHASVGSGKSLIIQILCRTFARIGWRVCVIVPSIELLAQTAKPLFDDKTFTVTVLGGGKKPVLGRQVLVTTAQSAASEIDKYDVVLIDEMQYTAAKTWQDLCVASINAKCVYGLTGTPRRADGLTDLIYVFNGPIVYRYTTKRATEEGFLAPTTYLQVPIHMPVNPRRDMPTHKEYELLFMHELFMDKVVDLVTKARAKGRPTLVLFKYVSVAKALAKRLGVDAAHGQYRLPFYQFRDGKCDLCVGTPSLLGTGIDVKRISALIYCASSASEIGVLQAFGRARRICEGKTDAVIVDCFPAMGKWKGYAEYRKQLMTAIEED